MASAATTRLGAARVPLVFALIAGISALAWAALAVWSAGPYARYLDHGRWTDLALVGAWCAALPYGETVAALLFHSGAWLLMIAAMMLPTVLPLVGVVARVAAGRNDARRVLAFVSLGYALAWSAFGVVAFALDSAVRAAAERSAWLAANGALLGAAVLAAAGAFQFSALKYHCLDRCRSPFGFVSARWGGRHAARDALRIGVEHGVFCVGCCWALMLVMFVVGMSNLAWMLALAALMAAEKNLPVGRRLAAPVGITLLAAAAFVALAGI